MKQEPFSLEIPIELTSDELIRKGAEVSRYLHEYSQLEAQKKLATSEYSTQLKGKAAEVARVSECLRSGKELREVECFERMNVAARLIEVIRNDTGAVLSSRPLTPDEHQLHLDVALSNMERQAKARNKADEAEKARHARKGKAKSAKNEQTSEVVAEAPLLALTANAGELPAKRKHKSGTEKAREKNAREAAAAAGKGSGKPAPKKGAASKGKGKTKKPAKVGAQVEREDFDTDDEDES